MRFCAIFTEDWKGDPESGLIDTLIFRGWQDEFLSLIAWWGTLMRRLALKKSGLEFGSGCEENATAKSMIEAFHHMMTIAAEGLTTSYSDPAEPNNTVLEETVGVYWFGRAQGL